MNSARAANAVSTYVCTHTSSREPKAINSPCREPCYCIVFLWFCESSISPAVTFFSALIFPTGVLRVKFTSLLDDSVLQPSFFGVGGGVTARNPYGRWWYAAPTSPTSHEICPPAQTIRSSTRVAVCIWSAMGRLIWQWTQNGPSGVRGAGAVTVGSVTGVHFEPLGEATVETEGLRDATLLADSGTSHTSGRRARNHGRE